MKEKKEWWEIARDVAVAIMAILAVIGVGWSQATKDMNYSIQNNTEAIKKLNSEQAQNIKWSDISELNDQLAGMNKGGGNGFW